MVINLSIERNPRAGIRRYSVYRVDISPSEQGSSGVRTASNKKCNQTQLTNNKTKS